MEAMDWIMKIPAANSAQRMRPETDLCGLEVGVLHNNLPTPTCPACKIRVKTCHSG